MKILVVDGDADLRAVTTYAPHRAAVWRAETARLDCVAIVRQSGRDDADDAALHGVVTATTTFLARLADARGPADRALHGAGFDAAVCEVRDRLVRDYALAAGEADRCLARARKAAAALLQGTPVRG